jgi:hypothetical protein
MNFENPTSHEIKTLFSSPDAELMISAPGGFALPIGWVVLLAASIEARLDTLVHGLRGLSLEETALPEKQLKMPFARKLRYARKLASGAMPPKIFAPLPAILKRAENLQKQRDDLVHGAWYYLHPQHGYAGKMRPGSGDGRFRPVEFSTDSLWKLVWEARQIETSLWAVLNHYSAYLFYRHPEHAHFEVPDGERELWD